MVGLALAIPTALITIIRLVIRVRARKLGLDDAFAASSLVGLFVVYVAAALHFDLHRAPPPSLVLLSHLNCFTFPQVLAHYSVTTRYMIYYIIAESFYWVIWYPSSISHVFISSRSSPGPPGFPSCSRSSELLPILILAHAAPYMSLPGTSASRGVFLPHR